MRGNHAVVVIGGGDHRGGVMAACFDIMKRRITVQYLELLGIITASVVGDPVPADGEFVKTEHVHYAHSG
ncbi:hypothetical protein D3C87_1932340 [compost metagenome]